MIHPAHLDGMVFLLGITLLVLEMFLERADRRPLALIALAGLGITLALSLACVAPDPGPIAGRAYAADPTALFFKRFFLATTMVVVVMALEFRPSLARALPSVHPQSGLGEFFALPVLLCAGLMTLVSAVDLILAFVALEYVTVGFYVLVAYMRRNIGSLEAGVKYLVLASLAGAILLYGFAWLFGITGHTNLVSIGQALAAARPADDGPLLLALALILAGVGFKIAAVPFQVWVPDVYQGAPTPVTAFLAVGSKAAGFVLLMRLLEPALHHPIAVAKLAPVLGVLAALSLILGNLAAIPQDNVKRMLAYSSIGHAGYMLMAIAAVGTVTPVGPAVAYYLVAYLLMTLLAFLALVAVGNATGSDEISSLRGLGRRSPALAASLAIALVSLAGIPFTAGFTAKLLVFTAALRGHLHALAVVGAIAVVAGLAYYLNVVRVMYWTEPSEPAPIHPSRLARATMALLAAGIIVVGVFPGPILEWNAKRLPPPPAAGAGSARP